MRLTPPCNNHTSSLPFQYTVERAVKLVSQASSIVEGAEMRHGQILSVMEDQRIRLPFDNKKDYKVNILINKNL